MSVASLYAVQHSADAFLSEDAASEHHMQLDRSENFHIPVDVLQHRLKRVLRVCKPPAASSSAVIANTA